MSDQIKCPWLLSLGVAGAIASNSAIAGLTDGASATLTARNFYLDRDYIRLRHAFYRNDHKSTATFRSDNETRLNLDYTLKIW